MLLEVAGLRKSFGSIVVADDLDLAIAQGEAVGVIGPNGAGKTTLFNLIAGGLSPNAGTIRFDGRDLAGTPPQARCRARGCGRRGRPSTRQVRASRRATGAPGAASRCSVSLGDKQRLMVAPPLYPCQAKYRAIRA